MVGKGKQGVVYSGIDSKTKMKIAIKLISNNVEEKKKYLSEIKVLKEISKLNENDFFPKIIWIEFKKRYYHVTELLGDSLMDIQTKFHATKGLRMKHVLMIGIQLLRRIKTLHSLGFVHGDIKPANIMFGRGNKKNILFLIDYGLTKKEDTFLKNQIPSYIFNKWNLRLNGTPLYASINAHLGWNKAFKKDDMESYIYMLINICKGKKFD